MTKSVDIRELILGILMEVTGQREYSHIAIRSVLEKYQYLEKQERAFITRVSEGTLEWMLQLDYILNQFSTVRVNKMKPVIRNILRMSVYQIKFMDSVPDSAVCNEAVKLAEKKGFHNLKGFVNGVLRSVARGWQEVKYPSRENTAEFLSVRYSMPVWIVEEWLSRYGEEETERILAAFLEKRPLTVRVNSSRVQKEALRERLTAQGMTVKDAPYLHDVLEIEDYNYVQSIPEFREGLFQVQDISSMLAVELADPKEGSSCMDVCAAPGGKCLHLADKLKGTGSVRARDLTEHKVGLIKENIERTGYQNITAEVFDACQPDEQSVGAMDVVLADLPCSGLGVLGKKTDLKYRMTREQQKELAALQRKILGTVQAYVKPGGILLYSTCTINAEENEENVSWFLEHFPFDTVSLDDCICEELKSETTAEGFLQLLPGKHACDGFFIAKLRRRKEQ